MNRWRRWLARLGEAVGRRSFDADLDDELAFHLESEAERLEREEGLSPREARRRARHAFDGIERCKEDVRDARGLPALTFLGRDLRYGLRELTRHPTFTVVAVLSLALGIGINVAIFSVVDATLFRPYSYDPDDRLVHIEIAKEEGGRFDPPTADQYFVLKELTEVFEDVQGSFTGGTFDVNRHESALGLLRFNYDSAGQFELLGARPILGRGFLPDDERPDAPAVVVLGYDVWQARFGADPTVVGQTLWLLLDRTSRERLPATIVGVLPDGHARTEDRGPRGADIHMPLRFNRGEVWTHARLAPGVTLDRAKAAVEGSLAGQQDAPTGLVARVTSHREDAIAPLRPTLRLLWAAVAVVLLIASANVVALTLARATARRREVATRLALGASRWRIIQLFVAEGGLLAFAGGALGTLLAYAGVQLIRFLNHDANPWSPQLFPRLTDGGVDGRVLGYTLLVSLVAAVLCSVAPARLGFRPVPGRALQDERRGITPGRFRFGHALVVAQVAIALVLLTGAGLVVRSMANLLAVDPGFEMDRLLTVAVSLPEDVYLPGSSRGDATGDAAEAQADDRSTRDPRAFHAELVERVGRLPGVLSAAGTGLPPLRHTQSGINLMFGDRPVPAAGERQRHGSAQFRAVVGDAFATLGVRVLRGRGFTADDTRESAPVVLISRNLAEEYWPDGDPIGQLLWFPDRQGRPQNGDRPRQIVGVVGDMRQWGLQFEPDPFVYVPHSQLPLGFGRYVLDSTLLVRTQGPPQNLVPAVREVVADLDPEWAAISDVHSMRELASIWTDGTRFYLLLLLVFATVGLGLALAGAYGVMAHAVTRRTHEIGVRMALGAARYQVVQLVVRQGLVQGLAGVAVGLVGAWWLTELVGAVSLDRIGGSILYDVEPRDVGTFVASAVLLFGAVLLACYGPTRRATRVDPMTVLQHE